MFETYAYEHLCNRIAARLVRAGLTEAAARTEASTMVEADCSDVPSHGVRMLPNLLAAIAAGRIQPRAQLRTMTDFGAIAILDCGNAPGRTSAHQAMSRAVEKARAFGIGACLARNTSHWGRAHAYATDAARAGCVGLCTTNAMPTMAFAGARKPILGNNPLALAVPYQPDPIVLDLAMSQAAVGKVATWLREGREVPGAWGIDADGKPSRDAQAILEGAVLPMGLHKGAGLAVMFELLTAVLAGGPISPQIQTSGGVEYDSSKLFVALDVKVFAPVERFHENARHLVDYLHSEGPEFLSPGERGWQAFHRSREHGVALHTDIVTQLRQAGVEL